MTSLVNLNLPPIPTPPTRQINPSIFSGVLSELFSVIKLPAPPAIFRLNISLLETWSAPKL